MRRALALLAATVTLLVPAATTATGSPAAISAQLVVGGLNYPAAFTFAPDGRIFYGERFTGEVHIYDPATHQDTLFFTISNVQTNGEQGLLGLALAPGYPSQPYLFAYATRLANGNLQDQILRIRDAGGTGTGARVIWASDTTAGTYHDGGRILFGPDKRLYAVMGEGHDSANAQDLTNDAGKVLRMTVKGTPAPGNPFPGSRIWTYGLRNSYGFTFDPLTGNLWETENGPECNDEVNRIVKGDNYAWGPSETCSTPPLPPANTNQDGPNPVLPLWFVSPTIAPVGTAFCVGCGITSAEGAMLFGAYNTGEIRKATLTTDRLNVQSVTTVYTHPSSPLSMERGPDGAVYFSAEDGGLWKLTGT